MASSSRSDGPPHEKELRLTLAVGTSESGYSTLVLTYSGAMLGRRRVDALRGAACNREACVLYNEIDVDEDGSYVHRLLFWPNEEVTIDFRERDYEIEPRGDTRVFLGGAFVAVDREDP